MRRSAIIKNDFAIVLAVIVVLAVLAVVLTLRGHLGKNAAAAQAASAPSASDQGKKDEGKEVTTKSGLKYIDLKVGNGDKAQVGSTVSVEYVGRFKSNGEKFDSSADHGKPLTFTIGEKKVIDGWEEGVQGMKVGGKRKLFVPYKLGYGDAGYGIVPPKADLVFEIELLGVKNP